MIPPARPGLAHLVEHVTFRGVGAHPEQDVTQIGAHHSASEVDAYTAYDYTVYYHVVPMRRLETAMYTEAERMATLVVTDAILLPEQDESLAERRAATTNGPEARFDERLRATFYGTHSYGVPILGWPDEVEKLTAHDVTTFYHTWYAPNNALLIVAGNITTARLKPLVQRYYGNILARPMPLRHRLTVPDSPGGQPLVMQDPLVHKPVWQRMYLAPSYSAGETKHAYALQVLEEILAGEPMSRLSRHLVVEKRLATAIDVEYLPDTLGSTDFTVRALLAPGVDRRALEEALKSELEIVTTKGVSQAEVIRAQRRLQGHAPLRRDHGHEVAETLGIALTTGRTLAEVEQWRERIAAVTEAQVHEAARAVLREERSVTGLLLPAASDAVRVKGCRLSSKEAGHEQSTAPSRETTPRLPGVATAPDAGAGAHLTPKLSATVAAPCLCRQ